MPTWKISHAELYFMSTFAVHLLQHEVLELPCSRSPRPRTALLACDYLLDIQQACYTALVAVV